MVESDGMTDIELGIADQFLIQVAENEILELLLPKIDLTIQAGRDLLSDQPAFTNDVVILMLSSGRSCDPLQIAFALAEEV